MPNQRLKTHFARIIVSSGTETPYYNILYYDPSDKEYHIGWGSYNLSYVRQWLAEEFEITPGMNEPVVHGEWISVDGTSECDEWDCSVCERRLTFGELLNAEDVYEWNPYCPNCGAKMEGMTMREILFRGKRKDTGEWVQGDLVHSQYKLGDTCVGQYGNTVGIHQVDPETVGQFTGLTDKNGKKIFEGDIIEAIYGNTVGECIEATSVVRFDDYELMWDIDHSFEIEVIGNIHDNPELLNGGGIQEMDDKKLVELIVKAKEMYADDYTDRTEEEYIAEMLLDNGVTVQEWISVKDRLPENECRCLVIDAAGDVEIDCYNGNGRFVLGNIGAVQHPSHWMPLPEPPKEG